MSVLASHNTAPHSRSSSNVGSCSRAVVPLRLGGLGHWVKGGDRLGGPAARAPHDPLQTGIPAQRTRGQPKRRLQQGARAVGGAPVGAAAVVLLLRQHVPQALARVAAILVEGALELIELPCRRRAILRRRGRRLEPLLLRRRLVRTHAQSASGLRNPRPEGCGVTCCTSTAVAPPSLGQATLAALPFFFLPLPQMCLPVHSLVSSRPNGRPRAQRERFGAHCGLRGRRRSAASRTGNGRPERAAPGRRRWTGRRACGRRERAAPR